jgi:ketosteroid isomerase-like protein
VPQQNLETVQRLIEAWNNGDYAAALDSIHPEVEATTSFGTEHDGTYRGHAGLAEMLRLFWAQFESPRTEIEEVIPASADVVLAVRFYGRGKRSGVEVAAPAWHVWTLRDGGRALACGPHEARSAHNRWLAE